MRYRIIKTPHQIGSVSMREVVKAAEALRPQLKLCPRRPSVAPGASRKAATRPALGGSRRNATKKAAKR